MQWNARVLEFIHQPKQAISHRHPHIVVTLGLRLVENQSGFLVDRCNAFEGAADIAGSEGVIPRSKSVAAGRLMPRPERFVDDIPGVQLAYVACGNFLDITVEECLPLG